MIIVGNQALHLKKSILQPYIKDGKVDYQNLREDKWFQKVFNTLETQDIGAMSHAEELAFWLNAYNLLTLSSVMTELQKNPNWQGCTSYFSKIKFFYLRKHKIAGRKISLYNLENKILRKKFRDPRIHFAINCASMSCPYLPNRLFIHDTLDNYLEQLTDDFINHQNSVIIDGNKILLNRIFKWYKIDFKPYGGIIPFIQKYWKGTPFPENYTIEYLQYDWNINSTK